MLKKSYYAQPLPLGVSWVWGQMGVDELEDKKDRDEDAAEALAAKANYPKWNSRQGGGRSYRGGRNSGAGGRSGGGRESGGGSGGVSGDTRTCFCCGKTGHLSRDCPSKNETCTFCGAIGHHERNCFDNKNGAQRMQRVGV